MKIGLTIFDIDETLFHTNAKIKVVQEKVVKILDNQSYNNYKLKQGESFDYGQFKSAKIFKETSTPIQKLSTGQKNHLFCYQKRLKSYHSNGKARYG